MFLLIGLYSVLMLLFDGGSGENICGSLFYFGIYAVILPIFFAELFNDIASFSNSFIICGIIQSLIIFGQYFSLEVRKLLDSMFYQSGNVSFLRIDRATGIGAEGATMGLFLGLSMLSCTYMCLKEKKIYLYVISYIIILVAASLVSRTGMLIGIILSIFMLVCLLKKGAGKFVTMLIATIPTVFIVSNLFNKYISNSRLRYLQNWLNNAFSRDEGSSIYALESMEIPPLSIETIFGTGIRRGYFGNGYLIQNDIGYIQLYAGLGIIVEVLFYYLVFSMCVRRIILIGNKTIKAALFLLVLLCVIFEAKEPFILKYIAVFFIVTITQIDFICQKKGSCENE